MARRKRATPRTSVRGKGWTRRITIPTEKYRIISRAILRSLTTTPMAFSSLVRRVRAKVPGFDGSVPWYTLSCLRELEARGEVRRSERPVRYFRPDARKRRAAIRRG